MPAAQNSGGGPATHAGTNYQNRVAAWVAVHILAEQEAAPPWDLPAAVTLESLQAESPNLIDDLEVRTSTGGRALLQVKHTVNLQITAASPLGKTIDQFVAEYSRAKAAMDPARERFVLVTSLSSSAKIRSQLPAFLSRVRTSPDLSAEWKAGNHEERKAASVLRDHITRAWRDLDGTEPTPDELAGLLRLMRIHILDVDQGGQAEHEAKEHLRKSVLADPTAADTAWHTLITATAAYAVNTQRADRPALQRTLTDAGISIRAPRSYHEDIDRLRAHTQRTVQALREFSHIQVGNQAVEIARTATAELKSAVDSGHLLVLGMPGAGKSGTLHGLATALLQEGKDFVACAVDQLEAASIGSLRTELGLAHDLTTVLANWPGKGPAYLVIDALDAARTDGAIRTLQTIIGEVITRYGRWHVVASVRKFDLRYNSALQRLFHGTPPRTAYTDPEFTQTRHLNVPILSEAELDEVKLQSPALANLMSCAPAPLHDLLRLPFNLRLLGDLLGAGMSAAELRPVRTQVELLDRYWRERIIRHDHGGDARELVLARAATTMVKNRVLRSSRAAAMGQETVASGVLHDLLSTHVLAESSTQTGDIQRDFLTFPHHVLFDYAVARLYLPREPDVLRALLVQEPDLLIAIRPSIEMHYQRLWHLDPGRFWDLVFRILTAPGIPEVGKLIGPSVAAQHAENIGQLQPLLDALRDPGCHGTGIAVLRHALATLTARETVEAGLWLEFLAQSTDPMSTDMAVAIRPYTFLITERASQLDPAEQGHLGLLGRRLLAYGLSTLPTDHTCIYIGIKTATRTVNTDLFGTVTLLQACLTPEHLAANAYRTVNVLAESVPFLAPIDPAFVHDLYVTALHHQETSTEVTLMGDSQIFPLRSTRKQDYQHGLWSLGVHYSNFLECAPLHAARALRTIVTEYVRRERHHGNAKRQPVVYDSVHTTLLMDYSDTWDRSSVHDHDAPIEMLNALQRYLEAEVDASQRLATCKELLSILLADPAPGVFWRRALRAGTRQPTTIGYVLRSLAWDYTILTAHDTTRLTGEFLRAIYPTLDTPDRERIEAAILAIPGILQPPHVAAHYRDRLLGCLSPADLVLADARALYAGLMQQGGPPSNQEDKTEVYWGTPDPTNQKDPLQQLMEPLLAFVNEHRNQVPTTGAISTMLAHLADLDSALEQAGLAAESLAHSTLAEVCTTMARNDEFLKATSDVCLLKAAARKCATHSDPAPNPESDARLEQGDAWSTAARIDGAEAVMALGRHPECLDAELIGLIKTITDDPVAAVRWQIAHYLGYLYLTAPNLMWELMEHFARLEPNRGVVCAALHVLQNMAVSNPTKVAALAAMVFNRTTDGPGARDVRDACVNIFGGLLVWQQEPRCTAMMATLLANPSRYHEELQHVIFSSGAWLVTAEHGINQGAFALLDRILSAVVASIHSLEERHKDEAVWPEPSAAAYRGLMQCANEAATRLRQASQGFDENIKDARDAVYQEVRPLLYRLADIGHPHIAHWLLETLSIFISTDPPGVLVLARQVVCTGSKYGYQYESLAEGLIVEMVARYLAEYRPVLREHTECHQALMDILDVFVRVGWPSAHRLTYRLGEIYR